MKIAVTGHRPNKLGGYNALDNFKKIRSHMRDYLNEAPEGELWLIAGGALGIDQFWMEVGLYMDLPVIAALPFKGYNDKWPDNSKKYYKDLLDKCEQVWYISDEGYSAAKMEARNRWMVDKCDSLVAYWDGSESGTKNCIEYAYSKNKIVTIFNPKDIYEEKVISQ